MFSELESGLESSSAMTTAKVGGRAKVMFSELESGL